MKRKQSEKIAERNQPILEKIRTIKADHPFWGYRRIWAHLKYIDKLEINKKRVLRIMRAAGGLLVKPDLKLKASRTPVRSKPRPTVPNQWWGIDMTKVLVNSFGWVYIVLVLDWYTKKIVGYHIGLQSKAKHWVEALDMAVQQQFPNGVRGRNLHLMNDNGCQPTSEYFMRYCSLTDIHQAFTSYNNPRGNADTERIMRTLKEELIWLREWASPFELADELKKWIDYYNGQYLHSALGYKAPNQFEMEFKDNRVSLLVGA